VGRKNIFTQLLILQTHSLFDYATLYFTVLTGTDPEKYQRGWLAQKLSSFNCHNNVQFTTHKMVQGCYNRWHGHAGGPNRPSFSNWSKIQFCQSRVGGNNVCLLLCVWQESFLFRLLMHSDTGAFREKFNFRHF